MGQKGVVVSVSIGAEARLRQQPMAVSNVDIVVRVVQTTVVVARNQVHGVHPRHVQLNQTVA